MPCQNNLLDFLDLDEKGIPHGGGKNNRIVHFLYMDEYLHVSRMYRLVMPCHVLQHPDYVIKHPEPLPE